MSTYWSRRQDLQYYQIAVGLVRRLCPQGGRLLDVGGGVQWGCRYLEWLPEFRRTSVELPDTSDCTLDGVELIKADSLEWNGNVAYDVVMCLQVLEHIPRVKEFAAKLFGTAPNVVLSVPYLWSPGREPTHLHDPVDEWKLLEWTERPPCFREIISERLVCAHSELPTSV